MAATATHRPGRQGKLVTYERDIVCLPMWFAKEGDLIKIPRKKPVRRFLAVNKLLGKIQLRLTMGEAEIFEEIRSVFRAPMGSDNRFPFKMLQPSGGDSRSLMVPVLSHSYRWTASAVAGRNAKTPIYILAKEPLEVWIISRCIRMYTPQLLSNIKCISCRGGDK